MITKTLMLRRGFSLAVPFMLLAALGISAQMDQRFAQEQKSNALALRKFEWKSRTEILKDGESKQVQLSSMRYDLDGNLLQTVLSRSENDDTPSRGLIGRFAQKKKKEFLEKIEELGRLARSYSELPWDRMQRFMTTANFSSAGGGQNLVRIEGRDVLQSGDTMTVFMDPATRRQRRVEIQTLLEQKPVRIVSEFCDLSQGGPTFMARSRINYNNNSVAIITDNFDHKRAVR